MVERVTWRGVQLDARTRDMMEEVAALSGPIYIDPSQGSYSHASASAGTHSGGGAIDLMRCTEAQFNQVADLMRQVGFAAWTRTPAEGPWPLHLHGIAVQRGGTGDRGVLAPAAWDQVRAYAAGRNGLANNGPDNRHTRKYVGQTWEQYRQTPASGEVPEMRIITSPGRGSGVYGAGYFKKLTSEERTVLKSAGVPEKNGNDREYDVLRAAALQGESA